MFRNIFCKLKIIVDFLCLISALIGLRNFGRIIIVVLIVMTVALRNRCVCARSLRFIVSSYVRFVILLIFNCCRR